jgi:hypothetical protein
VGSASNYWMEPCLVALAVFARAPLPSLHGLARAVVVAGAVGQTLWVAVAGVRSSFEGLVRAPREAAALAHARATCGAAAGDVVLADEAGLEMMLDGRVVQVPFVTTQLVRAGRYPVGQWQADVRRPAVRCLVMQSDLLERSVEDVDPAHDLFAPPLRATLRERFVLRSQGDGLWVYGVR